MSMTLRRTVTFISGAAAAPLIALAVAGCGSSGSAASPSTTSPTTGGGAAATVGVASSSNLGSILVDSQGRTLYLFAQDTGTTSTCSGACATAWPPLTASGMPTAGSGANASQVGTTPRSDNTQQVTYNGHPLYLFARDTKAGDTNGQGVNAFGASWFAVTPSGNRASSQSSGSGGTTTTPGGGGLGY
jgi:predicted lipoprotein with Yx(FWY)xxD motif